MASMGGSSDIELVEYGGRKYEAESISESVLGGVSPSTGTGEMRTAKAAEWISLSFSSCLHYLFSSYIF